MASYLMDTNVLLRAVQKAAPEHALVVSAIAELTANGATIYVAPQVLVEFRVVATRPIEVNGFGWDPASWQPRSIAFSLNSHCLMKDPQSLAGGLNSSVHVRSKEGKRMMWDLWRLCNRSALLICSHSMSRTSEATRTSLRFILMKLFKRQNETRR